MLIEKLKLRDMIDIKWWIHVEKTYHNRLLINASFSNAYSLLVYRVHA